MLEEGSEWSIALWNLLSCNYVYFNKYCLLLMKSLEEGYRNARNVGKRTTVFFFHLKPARQLDHSDPSSNIKTIRCHSPCQMSFYKLFIYF